MNYFRKTRFRESSLILVLLVIGVIYITSRETPAKEETDIQALIDAAVEQAVEEALTTTSDEYIDKTDETTATTMPPVLAVPDGNYWGQYSDGTWAIVLYSEKPENFEWAWDVFNSKDPSGAYGFDEFDENSTLIGTLVDFDCSFNRISKTEAHKEAFGVFETTIEYYDTYFDWAEDNYDYLTEEAVITISKIMRGVWTCDYDYLESISTEYLDFYYSGDAYLEKPSFSEYIAKYEDNYDDDNSFGGKYTYRLGALLYMKPGVEDLVAPPIACSGDYTLTGLSPGYVWPIEGGPNPKELNDTQIAKMSMFDNGVTKTLIENGSYGDGQTSYGFRLKISSDGIWYSYKFNGHTWRSDYATPFPNSYCISPPPLPEPPNVDTIPEPESPDEIIEGEAYLKDEYNSALLRNAGIIAGDTYDTFVILLESENGLPPGWYSVRKGGNPCVTDENGCKVPDDFIEYLSIRGSFCSWDWDLNVSSWANPGRITAEGSNLVAEYYGCFEGEGEFLLKIEPGSTFRSYRAANPPAIVIQVDK